MQLTQSEENKNRAISATITLVIFGLLLLFLILFQLITPNPPFPEGGGGGGNEMALGIMDAGNDNVEYGDMGKVTDVVTETKATEEVIEDPNAEVVNDEKITPEVKDNKTTVITPKKEEVVKPKTEAEKLAEKFKKNNGKNGGGIGDNDKPGENGNPNGDPFANGNGGHGKGDGGGDGDGKGPGNGPGNGPGFGGGTKFGADLKGRNVVIKPKLPSDTKEEGKVVVDIVVDSKGNVIEASPNGRGTTTSSGILKAKAKEVAMSTKFNVDDKYEEQKGTITIVFAFD
jgi:protein TonB